MLTIEFEQPFMVGGVIITEETLNELRHLQTGTRWCKTEKLPADNSGLKVFLEYMGEVTHGLLECLINADTDEKNKWIERLETMYMLRSSFESFKVPE